MRILVALYEKALLWAKHRYAPIYLGAVSFAESSFFPVPPDLMLAPMVLAKPSKAFWFAGIATFYSILGSMLGYLLGAVAFGPFISPLLQAFGYAHAYEQVLSWFDAWGFWAILLAAFAPLPYKMFTIGAGVMQFHFVLFVLGAVLGRSSRFFLVSGLLRWGGERMEQLVRKLVSRLGLLFIGLAALFVIWRLLPKH